MEQSIIEVVTAVFNGADERNWPKVQQAMAPQIFLDYSSLSGNPAAVISSEQIVTSWKNFLPGFDKTHHQLSNYKVTENGDTATVYFDGKADHFIDKEIWTVEGSYVAEIQGGLMTKLKFNLLKQSGNVSLPGEAVKRISQ